ncbi:hypothetical protein ACFFIT_05575, partial [Thorsellia kenyensis]
VDKRLKEHRTYFEPKNKLSEFEYHMLNRYLNCEEYKHLSSIQIVPRLMDDKGIYIASESTFYRFMRLTGKILIVAVRENLERQINPMSLWQQRAIKSIAGILLT